MRFIGRGDGAGPSSSPLPPNCRLAPADMSETEVIRTVGQRMQLIARGIDAHPSDSQQIAPFGENNNGDNSSGDTDASPASPASGNQHSDSIPSSSNGSPDEKNGRNKKKSTLYRKLFQKKFNEMNKKLK